MGKQTLGFCTAALLMLATMQVQATSFSQVAGGPERSTDELLAGTGAIYMLAGDRIFKSANNGSSWSILSGFPPRYPIGGLAVADSTLFAGTPAGVYRSLDDGASWELFNGSGNTALPGLSINNVLAAGSAVFAVTRDANFKTILSRSDAGAAAWSTATPSSIDTNGISDLIVAGSNLCILVGNSGMRWSSNGGMTWSSSTSVNGTFIDVAVSPADGSVYVVSSSGTLRRSTNSCQSFSAVAATGLANLTGRNATALGVSASGVVFAGLSDGALLSSSDNGVTFSAANSGSLPASTGTGFASLVPATGGILAASFGSGVHFKGGGDWQARNSGLRTAALNSVLDGNGAGSLLLGHPGGVLSSADSGASFADANVGLNKRQIRALLRDGNTLLAGSDSPATGEPPSLYRSTDGGNNWTQLQTASGLPSLAGFNGLARSGSAYLAIVSGAESTSVTGLYRSIDGGLNWARSVTGLPTVGISGFSYRNLAVAGNGDFYVYMANNGVYRSTDGGLNWTSTSSGLGGTRQGKVFAAGNTLFASASGIVYRSTDSGANWAETTGFAVSKFGIEILSLARDAAGALYLGDEHAGLSISKDDGLTWTPDSDGLAHSAVCIERINGLLFKDGKIYAAQGEGGGLRVADPVGAGAAGDSVSCTTSVDTFPNVFSFTAQNNVAPNQFAQSNTVSIAGLGSGVTVPVNISGGEYSLGCNGAFTAQAGTTGNAQVCVRHMTPNQSEAVTSTTLTVSNEASTFISRTGLVFTGRDDEINTAYGTNGFATVSGTNSTSSEVLVQPDGKVVVSGSNFNPSRFAVARRNADGTPDSGFGTNGLVTLTIGTNDTLRGMERQSDGKLILAGQTSDDRGTPQNGIDDIFSVVVVRLNVDGSLDSGFGTGGIAKLDINPNDQTRIELVGDVKVLADGSIVVAGSVQASNVGQHFYAVKFTSAGVHDTAFGNPSTTFGSQQSPTPHFINGVSKVKVENAGNTVSQVNAMAVQSDGKLLLAGSASLSGQPNKGIVARLTATGAVDVDYGSTGVAIVITPGSLGDIVLTSDGKALVAGNILVNNISQPYIARLNSSNGSLDTGFGNSGSRTLSGLLNGTLSRVLILADGRLAVLGSGAVDADSKVLYAVLTANGAYDSNFGPNGRGFVLRGALNGQAIGGNSIAQRSDGGVVVGGSFNVSGSNQFATYVFGGDSQTSPPGPDTTPNAFSFVNQTNVARNALITSAAVTIAGIDAAASVQVSGGSYSVGCTATYVTTAGTIGNGQTVCVRHTSSNLFSGNTDTLLTVGGVSATFRSTTLAQDTTPDAFTLVDQADVELSSVVTSAAITVGGINVPTEITVSAGGLYSIGNGSFTGSAGTVSNGNTVRVRHTSASTTSTAINTTLSIGGVSDVFTSTTRAAQAPMPDTTPDQFSFTDAVDAVPGAAVLSNAIVLAGLNQPAVISISGGEYRIGQGSFTAASGTVSVGQSVTVRGTAGALGATVNVSLTIGGVMDVFSITSANEVMGTVAPNGLSGSVSDSGGRPVAISTSAGQITNLRRVIQPAATPAGVNFPNGFFAFNITGLGAGGSAQVTITLPAGIRASSYVKCINGTCKKLPAGKAVINGSTVVLTLTDGDPDTDAGPAGDGEVVDPGAPAVDDVPLYTGSMGWATLALLPLIGWRRRRRH